METAINTNGITVFVELEAIRAEFSQRYGGRFQLNQLAVAPDPDLYPDVESIITGTAFSLLSLCNMYGITIDTVDFNTREVHFIMHPSYFACVREAVKIEFSQQRKPLNV